MDIYLENAPIYKRWFFKVASKGLFPTIISAVGFAYIAIPTHLQETIRRFLPYELRKWLLEFCTADVWLMWLLLATVIFAIWGGVGSHFTVRLVNQKNIEILGENELLKQDRESKSINCYQLFTNYLFSYYEKFKLTENERVSLYKLDMNVFSCIGRYSDNEVFNSKPD